MQILHACMKLIQASKDSIPLSITPVKTSCNKETIDSSDTVAGFSGVLTLILLTIFFNHVPSFWGLTVALIPIIIPTKNEMTSTPFLIKALLNLVKTITKRII
jgi:hypothetical protein